ncbi:hypothetical protein PHMEG_00039416 [Phytophthora megakarya]|uniref:Retrotransposon gag domain-containing protein n=1 Tax=Phytophthora megakarya TaxID=4795 RepID=A0A225UI96_9STRA|nr:hypothetical protein PHMEG_00039416 [Phytophthora megakarya]
MKIGVEMSSTGTSGETEVVIPAVLEPTVIPAIGVRVVARTRFLSSDKAVMYLRGGFERIRASHVYTFPQEFVSTWIDRVELVFKGAEISGRGTWTDRELYFILDNKLRDTAAQWWVDMDRRQRERQRTERVLLGQFYRCLDKTTRKLVQQEPEPQTLEEAVKEETDIDYPMDNVAIGMKNIGQAWATAPSRFVFPMDGTTGQTNVIPGISGTGLPTAMVCGMENGMGHDGEMSAVALLTNPQGVYNTSSGTWDPPPGRVWNGKYWAPKSTKQRKRSNAETSGGKESKKSVMK